MAENQRKELNLSIPLLSGKASTIKQEPQKSFYAKSNFISKIFFWWVYPTIQLANKVTLEEKMIDEVEEPDRSEDIFKRFSIVFKQNVQSNWALAKTLILTFKGRLFLSSCCVFIQLSLQMCNPLLINRIITYIQQDDKDFQTGIILVSLVFGVRFIGGLFYSHSMALIRKVGVDAVSGISLALLEKCLKVSFLSNHKHKTGEVINLMQVDTQRMFYATFYIFGVIFMPFQIAVALYLMFHYIGISFLAGLGVIFVTFILNLFIGKLTWTLNKQLMTAKDERTKKANELFSQIKFIKLNALEDYFVNKVLLLREKEMSFLKKRFTIGCVNVLLLWLSPMLIINATFAMYVLMDNNLTPANTFTIISLFQILQEPLRSLPQYINNLIEANVSIRRLEKFLLTDELMNQCIQRSLDTQESNSVTMQNGVFYWHKKGESSETEEQQEEKKKQKDSNKVTKQQVEPSEINKQTESSLLQESQKDQYIPILKDVTLQIQKGQFVSIVGDVGSGKSSLMQALIGEMIYEPGVSQPVVSVSGKIAYVSQKPWIQNTTVKNNIVFGEEYDEKKYQDAIKYSCLEQDLQILIKGDQTMIGEKGVNLSGGQKARVSLARAVYSESDIFLLDDPISAVDVHVGKFIMHQCLNGILKNKTRILITHALNYCQYTDYIYLLENGQIMEQGSFQIIKDSEIFQRIYQNFYKHSKEDEKESFEINVVQPSLQKKISQQSQDEKKEEKQEETKEKDEIDELMLQEDRHKGNLSSDTLIQYFKLNGGSYQKTNIIKGFCFFVFISFVTALQIASSIGANLWLAYWTKESEDDPQVDNIFYLKIYSAFSLTFGVLAFIRSFCLAYQSTQFSNKIHNKMIQCLSYAPQCQFFERVPLGRIMNRLTKDQSVLDLEIYWWVAWLYLQVFNLLGNTFLNVYASTYYMLIPVVALFIFAFQMQRFYMKASRELYRLESISKSPILSYFSETVIGLSTVRAYNKEQCFMQTHSKNLNVNRKIVLQQIYTNIWFQMMLTFFSYTVNISAIVFCVFYSTKNPAFAGLLMTYATQINDNIQYTIQALGMVETQIISFERCLAYTKVQPEPAYKQLVEGKLQNRQHSERSKFIQNWPVQGEIIYQDYSVQYRENLPPALKNVSLKIEPQSKIGVVGRTGAGKSTITLTLLRILESLEGRIFIDGVDISTLSLQQLRECITMIMQDATLFDGTLRQNIDPLNQHADEEIIEVLKDCCLSQLAEQRQEGINCPISEGGENLSAGEKQLVCIARAVLKKSQIVLIDEATANIDIETEQTIQDTIMKEFKNCTVITIAHRINTILHCDKVLVLDKGQVKEYGKTKDLLDDKDSLFYNIYQEALKEQKK